ncbi:MAG TPA: NAD(P)H-binding protein [Polyangium sp.]|nr:NAD(P)H-binding protein [Polyangium sp.]
MTASRVLLAGATGAIGHEVLRLLREKDHFVRALSRRQTNATKIRSLANDIVTTDATENRGLDDALADVDVVVSCLGANVSLSLRERRSFFTVDVLANSNLLESAKRSGVKRFVYLSAHAGPGYDHTRYMRAHLEMEERIRLSGLTYSFVRPTGVFSALGDLVTMAQMGFGSVAGDGQAKANPIHPFDVAEVIAGAVDEGPEAIDAGGPEVMTREEVMRLAFDVVGKKPRIMHVPRAVFRVGSAMMRFLHPRLSDMMEFVAFVTTTDSLAPMIGKRTLRPWFEELARNTKR